MIAQSAQAIAMLKAMGVTVYSRSRSTATQSIEANAKIAKAVDYVAPAALKPEAPALPERAIKAPRNLLSQRPPSVQRELVLPQAELKRFCESRMYRHLCLLFAGGDALAVVENAVLSDTALHFESPPELPVKLGSVALLKTNWRKRREAWLAIRLWRKQLKIRA